MTAVEGGQDFFQPGEFRRLRRVEEQGLEDDGRDLAEEGFLDSDDIHRVDREAELQVRM